MKRLIRHRGIYFYGVVVILALGLIAASQFYVTESQEAIARQREAGMAAAQGDAPRLSRVKVFRPFPVELDDVLTLPGTVEASGDVELAATIGGTVAEVRVEEGDTAEAGELLLLLDMRQQEAQLREAQINFALAQGHRADMERLFNQSIISRSERNEAVGTATRAQALVDAQQARVNDGKVKSPIQGVIDHVAVDVGEHVSAGQTIMRIVNIDQVKVVLQIPEKDVSYFSAGQPVQLNTRLDGKDYRLEGEIEYVTLTADPVSRTYPVKVIAPNPDRKLRPGMIVTASLVRRNLPEAIALPIFSVLDRDAGPTVFVLNGDRVEERLVETRAIQGGVVEIASGLESGEPVVVIGHRNLSDGEEVSVVEDLTDAARDLLEQGIDLARIALELAS